MCIVVGFLLVYCVAVGSDVLFYTFNKKIMRTMDSQIKNIKLNLEMTLKVIRMYEWLLDLYVLDFFVDKHWEKLPVSWRQSLDRIDPQILGNIISGKQPNFVLPLSLLSLLHSVKALTLPRDVVSKTSKFEPCLEDQKIACGTHPKLKNLFLKHVKLKKRHEISLMAEVVSKSATKSNCRGVLDFGSGLGHLVRVLAYKNDLYTAGLECQTQLTEEARKLDLEIEYTASKYLTKEAMSKILRPTHINVTLSSLDQLKHLLLPETMMQHGLIGLHPCGDLGPLLLRHFVTSENVRFICIVGCCYMKLTCDGTGYPMSKYLKGLDSKLSYVSREIACHAIEVYCERLRNGNYHDLKIHAYRAALERILVMRNPNLKHSPVRSIKHSNSMDLKKYCALALERLNIPLPTCPRTWEQGEQDLAQWRKVVTVYTLRLVLAPLVETVVLLDRVLFLLEHGFSCEIRPEFDPKISPRNHIITARR